MRGTGMADEVKEKKPVGRPKIPLNPEMADRICEILATTTKGLEQALEEICKDFPEGDRVGLNTVYRWLCDNPEFAKQYASAREHQAQILHDRAQKEAEDIRPVILTKKGKRGDKEYDETATSDNYNRSRLIVDTMLKRAGQLNPKKYSEKLMVSGDSSNPLSIEVTFIGQPKEKEEKPKKK
jgi:hypothetical protein